MAKKPNFANEIDAIENSVEADVDRVINLLRDGNSPSVTDVDDSPGPSDRNRMLTIKAADHGSSDRKRQEPPRPVYRQRIDDVSRQEQILENVTTRLMRGTNLRLTEAALRQKLAKQIPDSRQAIIEEALSHWLKRNNYA